MSSTTRKKCVNDDGCKQAAVSNCEGCSKAFCIKHFSDHRHLLDEEMNVIIDEHDHLKNTLNHQTTKNDSHPDIKEIDKWETESITRIQQRANELRQALIQLTTAHTSNLSKKLQHLTEQLQEARENNDFIEADLQRWRENLEDLKAKFSSPAIAINRCRNFTLVSNITVNWFDISEDLFEQTSDNTARIEKNGQVAIHENSRITTEVRGKNEYVSGLHKIRICIEQSTGDWMFFGINSKSTPLQCRSCNSGSAYGWTGQNGIWTHGEYAKNKSSPPIELKTNDIITLIFDCDNCKISITNGRTMAKHELSVSIVHCPFPWQLHVILFEPNSRVRIL
jgi:hypothetical protein